MNTLDKILQSGNAGEITGGLTRDNSTVPPYMDFNAVPPYMDFNAVMVLAQRYLMDGPDTVGVSNAIISGWEVWPMVWARQDWLPEGWHLMPKGLLQNYFKWRLHGEGKSKK